MRPHGLLAVSNHGSDPSEAKHLVGMYCVIGRGPGEVLALWNISRKQISSTTPCMEWFRQRYNIRRREKNWHDGVCASAYASGILDKTCRNVHFVPFE